MRSVSLATCFADAPFPTPTAKRSSGSSQRSLVTFGSPPPLPPPAPPPPSPGSPPQPLQAEKKTAALTSTTSRLKGERARGRGKTRHHTADRARRTEQPTRLASVSTPSLLSAHVPVHLRRRVRQL